MIDGARVLALNIPIGEHVTGKLFGFTVNLDTIWTTVAAGVVVVGLGLLLRRQVTSGVPGKLQLAWETIVDWASDQVESSLGPQYRHVAPMAVAIFTLVLFANWLEILPGLFHNTDFSPAPTADVNLTYALGVFVFVVTNGAAIRKKGLRGYARYLLRPPKIMLPLHIIEEIVKPFSLALRLFGNLFSGGIMIALLISFPIIFFPATIIFTVVWKLFDMLLIGVIQAFIFALLCILYYQFAVEEGH